MENRPAFIAAVETGDIDTLKHLLATDQTLVAAIDAPWFSFDAPAIVHAAAIGNRALIEVLLAAGADINVKSQWWAGGTSALQHVTGSMLNYDPSLAAYLIEQGATVDAHAAAGLDMYETLAAHLRETPAAANAPGSDGMSPLHFAATPRIAKLLLEHGADINRRDRDHNGTPAQWTMVSRPDVSRYLLSQGAEGDLILYCVLGDVERATAALEKDPDLLDLRIKSNVSAGYVVPPIPRNLATEVRGGHVYTYTVGPSEPLLEIALKAKQPAILEMLLARGYQIKLREWYMITGQGPRNMDALVKQFLKTGWDINGRQQHRHGMWAPLHWLAQRGLAPGMRCLLENGADPNVTDDAGRTPMHILAQKGFGTNQMQLLIEAGGDIRLRDAAGKTALDYAQTAKKKSIRNFLDRSLKEV